MVVADFTARLHIDHRETKIGDTLCVLPLIMQMAEICATDVHVSGAFAAAVRPLVAALPIRFDALQADAAITARVDIAVAYNEGRALNQHMAASICRLAGWPLPALPISLALTAAPHDRPAGIVLSPFSGSANPWYKAWPQSRWLRIVQYLRATQDDPIYVLAASGEDAAPFAHAGAIPLSGLTLPAVLSVMQRSSLFISIDNGLSHLAHFGAVPRHLLIYPELLPPNLVVNPRASVLRGRPEAIAVAQVIDRIQDLLQPPAANRHEGVPIAAG